ncbi:MAG: PIN domain-containing protein [Candidatus Dormibacteraceae bacterium]
MRVLADSHTIYWYLNDRKLLSDRALEALLEAEADEGIGVSVLTLPDLWMAATRKRGVKALSQAEYEILKKALLDPENAIDAEPLTLAAWDHFELVSRKISDPMDGLIIATALALDVPLVSKDRAIRKADVVEVIW